jgi:hypothetical protein
LQIAIRYVCNWFRTMTRDQAMEQLRFHSGRHPDVDNIQWENGFLPSLRPYKGLNRNSFDNLMACLNVLKDGIKEAEFIERELILDLWTICHYSKAWGTDPEGMIRSNNLISEDDLRQLEDWINKISCKVSFWLEGIEEDN